MDISHQNSLTPRQKRLFAQANERQKIQDSLCQEGTIQLKNENVAQTMGTAPLSPVMSMELFYKMLQAKDAAVLYANLILWVRHWLMNISSFDPVSGGISDTNIVDFIQNIACSAQNRNEENFYKDRIYHIVLHTQKSIENIIDNTRTKIVREHAMLPFHAAREVDSSSMMWLNRQPGRTVREKLAGKPYMKAVKCNSSLDTIENRLFKSYIVRLEHVLTERQRAVAVDSEDICNCLNTIQRWLCSAEASEIGTWGHVQPNNILLQDRNYRKIWDAWQWLLEIDEAICRDSKRLKHDLIEVIYWEVLASLYASECFRIVQQPISIDYDSFSITPKLEIYGYIICSDDAHNTASAKKLSLQKTDDTLCIFVDSSEMHLKIVQNKFIFTSNIGNDECFPMSQEIIASLGRRITSHILGVSTDILAQTYGQYESVTMSQASIDLYSMQPEFVGDDSSVSTLPFMLLQQHWPTSGTEKRILSCGNSNALYMDKDVETVSIKSLLGQNTLLSSSARNDASRFFVEQIRQYLQADFLTYLVPDWINDFDLESIRKNINFYFKKSAPIPKSIASIFAWQSTESFIHSGIKSGDFVFIIDNVKNTLAITPLQARFNDTLREAFPESHGITWERHPTTVIDEPMLQNSTIQALDALHCHSSKHIANLLDIEGLAICGGKLSLVHDNIPIHFPECIANQELQNIQKSLQITQYIESCRKNVCNMEEDSNIFILPVGTVLPFFKLASQYKSLKSILSPVLGSKTLLDWQKQMPNLTLWRDNLPELSIKIVTSAGCPINFYLVKNQTIIPNRGEKTLIAINEPVTLPAGHKEYKFPLQQGKGSKELAFIAYIKSSVFPLQQDTDCSLYLIYTYGADNPYELTLTPCNPDNVQFKSLKVTWRSKREMLENIELPYPEFPSAKTWADFEQYPSLNGKPPRNLLDWICGDIQKISSIATYGRVQGPIQRWIPKGENTFCFIEDTYINAKQLLSSSSDKLPSEGTILSFYKIERIEKGKFCAYDISIDKKDPTCFLSKSLHFPMATVWNNTNSLSDSSIPKYFKEAIEKGINHSLSIIQDKKIPNSLKMHLFLFLSYLHKDAPPIVKNQLLKSVVKSDLLQKYYKNIAYAIGDANLEWQNTLLKEVVNPLEKDGLIQSICLEILGIALWRSKMLLNKISKDDIIDIHDRLYNTLKHDIDRIKKSGKWLRILTVCNHLELLLALLRYRECKDNELKNILHPNKELTHNYINLIDDITQYFIKEQKIIRPKVLLEGIKKPEIYAKTPDILYALKMYLSGDQGANTIIVRGISNEENT